MVCSPPLADLGPTRNLNWMSRSIHQTVKGVFSGRSVADVDAAVAERDEDVEALSVKRRLKKDKLEQRKRMSDLRSDAGVR